MEVTPPRAEAAAACAGGAEGASGMGCVRDSARSTMPSNIGMSESAGTGF